MDDADSRKDGGSRGGPKVRLLYTNRKGDDGTASVTPQSPSASTPSAAAAELVSRQSLVSKHSSRPSTSANVDTASKTVEAEARENDDKSLAADVTDGAENDVINHAVNDKNRTDENANDIVDASSGSVDEEKRKDKHQTPRPSATDDARVAAAAQDRADENGADKPDATVPNADSAAAAKKNERRRSAVIYKSPLERQVSTVGRITERYEMGKQLGDGNFAVVHQCRQRDTGREYAMKIVDKAKMRGKEAMVENEIAIIKACRHPNIVKLYEEYETKNEIYLVMELVKVSSTGMPLHIRCN
jgi:Protein kinase domain